MEKNEYIEWHCVNPNCRASFRLSPADDRVTSTMWCSRCHRKMFRRNESLEDLRRIIR